MNNGGINPIKLTNTTTIAWSTNEHGHPVMLNSSFSGIVELRTHDYSEDGLYGRVELAWRDKEKYAQMPSLLENVSLDTAKSVVQTAYMMYGDNNG